jgi:hypothetical protein
MPKALSASKVLKGEFDSVTPRIICWRMFLVPCLSMTRNGSLLLDVGAYLYF